MQLTSCVAVLIALAPLAAQNYYIPDSNPNSGTANMVPFGNVALGMAEAQAKMQTKATRADLGSVAGVLTGLGFVPTSSGVAHFDSIEIVIDHHPAGAPLTHQFAANLTPAAVTVLSATNYHWTLTSNAWNEVGLQNAFAYNGVDDVVIQITTANATSPTGFRRDFRPRVYWRAATGTAPAMGSLVSDSLKMQVGMSMGRVSRHGVSCPGSTGTRLHAVTGAPLPGQSISLNLAGGVPNGIAFLVLGFQNGAPYPQELSAFGMPACFQYTDIVIAQLMLVAANGGASFPFAVPAGSAFVGTRFYSQYACVDPGVNAAGITTTNYARVLIGN